MEKNISNESSEVKVTVTLFLNASFTWMEKPSKIFIPYYLVSCIFLGVLALTAIAFNLCLVSAIFCNSNLKKVILNQFVSMVSVACILDCSVNVPFSLYQLKETDQTLGRRMCKLNSAWIILINLMTTWGMCGVCFERWFSIFQRNRFKVRNVCKQGVAMIFPVAMTITALLPIALDSIEVRFFPNRFSCSIAAQRDQPYRIALLLYFVIPVAIGLLALSSAFIQNYRKIRNVSCQSVELSYAELFFEESHLWNEWQSSKFVTCITLLYLSLELPFIINQIEAVPKSPSFNLLLKTNSTAHFSTPTTQVTSPIDRAYSWCRFVFCLMFPLTTMILRKDIRRKISSLMSFFKTNSSISSKAVDERSLVQTDSLDDFLVPQVWRRRRRLSSVTCLTSPIVFGKSRVGSAQFQLLDLSTGMAKWKASYDETKKKTITDTTLFDDAFEDEEDIIEYTRYEDGTEEEINSSEDFQCATTAKEVAVQTNNDFFENDKVYFQVHRSSPNSRNCKILNKKLYKNRNRRLSKSFTSSRTNTADLIRRNYYLTYPKMSDNAKAQRNLTTSDLMKVLKAYKSRKYVTTCDIFPRSTTELMDCSLEDGKNIVSL